MNNMKLVASIAGIILSILAIAISIFLIPLLIRGQSFLFVFFYILGPAITLIGLAVNLGESLLFAKILVWTGTTVFLAGTILTIFGGSGVFYAPIALLLVISIIFATVIAS